MQIHNMQAINRGIMFIDDIAIQKQIKASEQCCWNCFWSMMTYDCLWCEKEMDDVDMRDLCTDWEGDFLRISA